MAASDNQSESTPALAAWITGHRRAILDAIRFYDGEAHTSNIREYGDVPRGSFNHHIEALLNPPEKLRDEVNWLNGEGLIEVTGEVDVGKPAPARQFALTDAGERIFGAVIDDVDIRASDVRDLQQRIGKLEQENETLKQKYNRMANVIENLIDENGLTKSP